nr:hypothetical protein [Candidatus Gastranaerophilales bacterium]
CFLLHIYAIAYMVFPLLKMVYIIEKYLHIENLAEDFSWHLFIFGFPIISILVKILIFPILYKIKFFSNIKDFLERFATDKIFLIKVLSSILIFDIIVYLLTTFFLDSNHYWRYTENLKINLPFYLWAFFGVLPCYLSFLLWYKWTHRKKHSENFNE